MSNRIIQLMILFIAITTVVCSPVHADIAVVSFESHNLHLKLDVPEHSAAITDSGLMQVDSGWNLFYLNGDSRFTDFSLSGRAVDYFFVQLKDTANLPDKVDDRLPELETEGDPGLVLFEAGESGIMSYRLSFEAEFFQDVGNIRFSNEMVGAEVRGTISELGAYLSPAGHFYPMGNEDLSEYRLSADIPSDWECVSDGNLLGTEIHADRKVVSFANPFRADGLMFMAAPFVVRTTTIGNVEVACYFFESDTGLIADYLTASADYIRMYSELIGPYPYQRFSVVENFFPTGYGMPAWTLLGQQVLRLPFIKNTSLGHEVLHNWWGNSVYVDYERGNWCEGATVYGADYRYKLLKSQEAAREYRRDILKQYVSYVNEGNDFPVREFKSRTSPGTRTIGYNKAMMAYHMIEEEIGTKAFFNAWRLIFERYQMKKISWEEWITAFEETSGKDLAHIITQWIDRTGAPVLALEVAGTEQNGDNKEITFAISENSGQKYRLKIPVRFAGENIVIDTSVLLTENMSQFTVTMPAGVQTIELDPDCHLFRRLYPEEVEPIISGVLGIPTKRFFAAVDAEEIREGFQLFGENLSGDSVQIEAFEVLEGNVTDYVPILLNPTEIPGYLSTRVLTGNDSITVDGVSYPRDNHTVVLTGEHWNNFEKFMVIITSDYESLPRIGRLVPHYGKYSYLVFAGPRNIGKGQWKVDSSPLRRVL